MIKPRLPLKRRVWIWLCSYCICIELQIMHYNNILYVHVFSVLSERRINFLSGRACSYSYWKWMMGALSLNGTVVMHFIWHIDLVWFDIFDKYDLSGYGLRSKQTGFQRYDVYVTKPSIGRQARTSIRIHIHYTHILLPANNRQI